MSETSIKINNTNCDHVSNRLHLLFFNNLYNETFAEVKPDLYQNIFTEFSHKLLLKAYLKLTTFKKEFFEIQTQ